MTLFRISSVTNTGQKFWFDEKEAYYITETRHGYVLKDVDGNIVYTVPPELIVEEVEPVKESKNE